MNGLKSDLLLKVKDGDVQAQHDLFFLYEHLPKRVVKDFLDKHPSFRCYQDDLLSQGTMILYKSIPSYNPDKGGMTNHYYHSVKFGLLDYVNSELNPGGIHIPKYLNLKNNRDKKVFKDITAYLQEDSDFMNEIPDHRNDTSEGESCRYICDLNHKQLSIVCNFAKNELSQNQYDKFINYFGINSENLKLDQESFKKSSVKCNVVSIINKLIKSIFDQGNSICEFCHKSFDKKRRNKRFCSKLCRKLGTKGFLRNCKNPLCNKEFSLPLGGAFCSRECKSIVRKNRSTVTNKNTSKYFICDNFSCGKKFKKTRDLNTVKNYCCQECMHARRKGGQVLKCQRPSCGKQFPKRLQAHDTNKYCSLSCFHSHKREKKNK